MYYGVSILIYIVFFTYCDIAYLLLVGESSRRERDREKEMDKWREEHEGVSGRGTHRTCSHGRVSRNRLNQFKGTGCQEKGKVRHREKWESLRREWKSWSMQEESMTSSAYSFCLS